ncbi:MULTISPECIES: hypothetical protein [unclassified Cyanobium]|uniref:hypothetical protein n=1 Tax=unclassified Cyanobium TaxID=2627006 RepID=UPI0020CD7516|nr:MULTISPECIES: hypothetical protein [unclassified Cyanobium]MCP9834998.1 hypothetical protein [Cyanobium sp. La Preciosa 7G6]MCP9937761.1 hypothetical protein [Cyanobium sp. Aljojuca 7A6]
MAELALQTLAACGLVIGAYPRFRYDARGGGGVGRLSEGDSTGSQRLLFDPDALNIPPLHWRTTRFLGLPLPPGLVITIHPQRFDGSLDGATGAMALRFCARFRFAIGSLYRAPDLIVDTMLSTGPVRGRRHQAMGQPLDGDGLAQLVGVATIAPSGDPFLDRFLGLPDEALALLRCRFGPLAPDARDLP